MLNSYQFLNNAMTAGNSVVAMPSSNYQNVSQAICTQLEAPLLVVRRQLEREAVNAVYLVNQFDEAISNITIRAAINNIISKDRQTIITQSLVSEITPVMTSVGMVFFTTVEGKQAVVLVWQEDNAKVVSIKTDEILGRQIIHNNLAKSFLMLTDREIVFIPGPRVINKDTLMSYYGMQVLYGPLSYRRLICHEVIRKVADTEHVVKLLGQTVEFSLRKGSKKEITLHYLPDKFIVKVKREFCGEDTEYRFEIDQPRSAYGYLKSLFNPQREVIYKESKSVADFLISMIHGEEHCDAVSPSP